VRGGESELLALNDFKKRRSRIDRKIGNTVILGVPVIYVQDCGQVYVWTELAAELVE